MVRLVVLSMLIVIGLVRSKVFSVSEWDKLRLVSFVVNVRLLYMRIILMGKLLSIWLMNGVVIVELVIRSIILVFVDV